MLFQFDIKQTNKQNPHISVMCEYRVINASDLHAAYLLTVIHITKQKVLISLKECVYFCSLLP